MDYRKARETYEKELSLLTEKVKRVKRMIRKLKSLEELEVVEEGGEE